MSVEFRVLYYYGPGPVQYTIYIYIYWTGLLTKTNSVNKNVKHNILTFLNIDI
jgi:hypothetical protein